MKTDRPNAVAVMLEQFSSLVALSATVFTLWLQIDAYCFIDYHMWYD